MYRENEDRLIAHANTHALPFIIQQYCNEINDNLPKIYREREIHGITIESLLLIIIIK
jgi:hypothetical protein